MMNKERLEAFTDAIVAILATIIVLELKAPEELTWHSLFSQWHMYFAYITSFILLYGTWYNHHGLFERANRIDAKIFWANGLWILSLSFIPYVTELVGEHPSDFIPEFLYLVINFLRLASFQFLGTVTHHSNPEMQIFSTRYFNISMFIRFGSLILAMIISYWWPLIGVIWTFILVITYMIIGIVQEQRLIRQAEDR